LAEYGLKYRLSEAYGRVKRLEKLATFTLLFLLLTIATASVTSVLIGPDWGSLWKGLLLGLLAGWYRRLFFIIDPFLSALYATPRIALLPLIIIWLGIA